MSPSDPWYQQVLIQPDVVEVHVRYGVIPSVDHAQAAWEVKDPTTGILLAAGSVHHTTLLRGPGIARMALSDALSALDDLLEPF